MSKKLLQILSLIASILVLIYLILEYKGIIRRMKLNLYSTEYYTKKYPSLDKADTDKVIIAFESPDNWPSVKPFIHSMLDQTVRVDELAVIIPYKNISQIPSEIKPILNIIGYSKNYSSPGVICSVLKEPEANTKIILVNPNIIYSHEFVQDIIDKSKGNTDKIILAGKNVSEGMLIKPKFFTDKLGETECKKWTDCCKIKDMITASCV